MRWWVQATSTTEEDNGFICVKPTAEAETSLFVRVGTTVEDHTEPEAIYPVYAAVWQARWIMITPRHISSFSTW